MADDQAGDAAKQPGKAPSPAPLPERARAAAEEIAKAVQGRISRGRAATPADHAVPSHSPDASEDGEASDEKARGKNLGQPRASFTQRLEELRQSLPDAGRLERAIEKGLEPDCP